MIFPRNDTVCQLHMNLFRKSKIVLMLCSKFVMFLSRFPQYEFLKYSYMSVAANELWDHIHRAI